VTLRFTVLTAVASAVDIKFTALLSSQPTEIILCVGLTVYLMVPRGRLLASAGVNNVLFGTNF
jgi:hypothetical protein